MKNLNQLKQEIGEKLYNQLSDSDKDFMIKTIGSIDFGHSVDLIKIAEDIEEYKN